MMVLAAPLFGSSMLFVAQLIFGRAVNVGLGVIAGVSLTGIVSIGATIKEGAPKENDIIFWRHNVGMMDVINPVWALLFLSIRSLPSIYI